MFVRRFRLGTCRRPLDLNILAQAILSQAILYSAHKTEERIFVERGQLPRFVFRTQNIVTRMLAQNLRFLGAYAECVLTRDLCRWNYVAK